MKDKSCLQIKEFLLQCILHCLVIMIWYKKLIFRCLGNLTYTESRIVLWTMLLVSILMGAFVVFKYKKTGWTAEVSLLIPYGIYTVWGYWKTIESGIKVILGVSIILSIAYSLLVLHRKIHNRKKMNLVLRNRFYKCVTGTFSILAVGMSIIMISIAVQGVCDLSILKTAIKGSHREELEQYTISNNINTVLKLQEYEWTRLATQEKIDVLQVIANIEANYLGLPNKLNVQVSDLEEDTLGCYVDETYTIYIDVEHIENDSSYAILESCCHEAYHSYQHRLVDAYKDADESLQALRLYKNVRFYEKEFADYSDGSEDILTYYFQQCEIDAREYAESAVEDYYLRISEYIETEKLVNANITFKIEEI